VNTRSVSVLSLTCLLFTILWLAFLIVGMITAGELNTFEKTLAYVSKLDTVFYITYVNAALITVNAVMLFATLYIYYKPVALEWATIGIVFVPIYGAMNLVAYLSQITIVPRLLQLQSTPDYQALSLFALHQVIQQWPIS